MKKPAQDIHPVCRMRSGIVCLGLLCGFALIGCRLFYLQVIQAEAGAHQAQRQHQKTVIIKPDRGVILDRQGHPLGGAGCLCATFGTSSSRRGRDSGRSHYCSRDGVRALRAGYSSVGIRRATENRIHRGASA